MSTKIIKVAIMAIRKAMLFVLACLSALLRYAANLIAGLNIPGWDFIKLIVTLFPRLLFPPAVVAAYVLTIVEIVRGEYSSAAVTAAAGTWFLGWIVLWRIVQPQQREAELAERSFRDEFVAPLPSDARDLYDKIIATSGIQPDIKGAAKVLAMVLTLGLVDNGYSKEVAAAKHLVTMASYVERGLPRKIAEGVIQGILNENYDDQVKLLANAIANVIHQMPSSAQ